MPTSLQQSPEAVSDAINCLLRSSVLTYIAGKPLSPKETDVGPYFSLHPCVFSPIGNALCLHNTAAALLRLCSLISHISCVAPFCRDILITGVTPDPTCSSQSRLSCFFSFQCRRRFWLKSFVTIVTTHIDLGMTLRLPSFNYLFIHCIGFHTENLSLGYFCIIH